MAANRSSTSAPVRPKSASVYRCPGPRPAASAAISERIASAAAPDTPGSATVPFATLQSAPQDDLRSYRLGKAGALEGYRWVDRAGGVVQIPIERAMELLASEQSSEKLAPGITPAVPARPQPRGAQTR